MKVEKVLEKMKELNYEVLRHEETEDGFLEVITCAYGNIKDWVIDLETGEAHYYLLKYSLDNYTESTIKFN